VGLNESMGAATISAMRGFYNYYKKAIFLDKLLLQLIGFNQISQSAYSQLVMRKSKKFQNSS